MFPEAGKLKNKSSTKNSKCILQRNEKELNVKDGKDVCNKLKIAREKIQEMIVPKNTSTICNKTKKC